MSKNKKKSEESKDRTIYDSGTENFGRKLRFDSGSYGGLPLYDTDEYWDNSGIRGHIGGYKTDWVEEIDDRLDCESLGIDYDAYLAYKNRKQYTRPSELPPIILSVSLHELLKPREIRKKKVGK